MNSYKFLLDWEDVKAGEVLTFEQLTAKGVTEQLIQDGLGDGTLELVLEDTSDTQLQEDHFVEGPVGPVMKYQGKEVVQNGIRDANGKQYRHIRTADGAEYDLTDEEYAQMEAAK